jgi:hypothetical protein
VEGNARVLLLRRVYWSIFAKEGVGMRRISPEQSNIRVM